MVLDFGGDRTCALSTLAKRLNLTKALERKTLAALLFRLIKRRAPQDEIENRAIAEGTRLGLSRSEICCVCDFGSEAVNPDHGGRVIDGFPNMTASYTAQAAKSSIWTDSDEWDEARTPGRRWIVPGYALRGAVSLVAAPPSALKSSTMLGWASAIAVRSDYGRFRPIVSGPVIVYNVEDDLFEQRRRLSATLRQFGATPADIKDKIYRVGPATIGTLFERGDDGKVRFTATMTSLDELIGQIQPVMLVVDPLAELHACEEDDNTAIRAVIARFREMAVRSDMAVVILHHTRKGAGQSPGDPDAARGASAIIGAVRVAVNLTMMSEDDAKAFGLPSDPEARSNYVRMDDAKEAQSSLDWSALRKRCRCRVNNRCKSHAEITQSVQKLGQ